MIYALLGIGLIVFTKAVHNNLFIVSLIGLALFGIGLLMLLAKIERLEKK